MLAHAVACGTLLSSLAWRGPDAPLTWVEADPAGLAPATVDGGAVDGGVRRAAALMLHAGRWRADPAAAALGARLAALLGLPRAVVSAGLDFQVGSHRASHHSINSLLL